MSGKKATPIKLHESKLGRVIFARLSENEDLLEAITLRAKNSKIVTGFFILIGVLKKAMVGFYRRGEYQSIEIAGPLEILSCIGNISIREQEPFVHAHISVADEKGEAFGGHVLPGCIIAVTGGELILIEAPDVKLQRKLDEKTKLYLWEA